ncbi:allantoinase AllB [Carnobacterium divergens]|uniref:allantoinase AllB n=1 Tax=Carnobacterium divergens TaxID=2748 RepID=UPI0010729B7F|nr:allantoinase AllB [Carnobacterium divergens]TFJ38553.1 allantoinase AllB [Carnobacterium divergens]TFJ47787.1 allantoinase AllB [Carnobacterium divergens]TFJ52751.1 allantoinase AllB [Carnobacterium divergens]TFJ58476.1 allantoinase AllB [Carnobacterium divergens]TFJ68541.1 allantoinase AllB [Carnobacterium divergens]
MNYDLLIKNGTVILEDQAIVTNIAVKDGKIAAIGADLTQGTETIDARKLIVSPGMVDAHVHISEPGRTHWEGYQTGTKAAAKGGVTTFIEMPLNQLPATTSRETLQLKFDAAKGKLSMDVALFGGLVPYNLEDLEDLNEEGVVAFKCFLATCGFPDEPTDFQNVDDYSFFAGMKKIAKMDSLLAIHAENALICDELGKVAQSKGQTSTDDYVASRPPFTEVEAVRRAIYLAKVADCQIHICHLSTPEAISEVTKAKQSGQRVTCESCTHYFALNQEQFADIGMSAKCAPPLRDQANQELLWEKLFNGEIDFVTSDHSPCPPEMKIGNAFTAWGGISGLQNNVDILFDEAVQKRGMSLTQFADLIATAPANLYQLKTKGSIAIGKDADFTFIKPKAPYTLKESDLEYKNKISPYIGREIGCQVVRTILRGETIYDKQTKAFKEATGHFLLK